MTAYLALGYILQNHGMPFVSGPNVATITADTKRGTFAQRCFYCSAVEEYQPVRVGRSAQTTPTGQLPPLSRQRQQGVAVRPEPLQLFLLSIQRSTRHKTRPSMSIPGNAQERGQKDEGGGVLMPCMAVVVLP